MSAPITKKGGQLNACLVWCVPSLHYCEIIGSGPQATNHDSPPTRLEQEKQHKRRRQWPKMALFFRFFSACSHDRLFLDTADVRGLSWHAAIHVARNEQAEPDSHPQATISTCAASGEIHSPHSAPCSRLLLGQLNSRADPLVTLISHSIPHSTTSPE